MFFKKKKKETEYICPECDSDLDDSFSFCPYCGLDLLDPEEEVKEREEELKSRIERYQKVIQLDPNDVLGYFSLGSAYLDGKRLEEARQAFEKAVSVNSDHSPSYFNLGLSLESLGQKEEAIKIYEQGLLVADAKGDMIPLRKMEARLKMLKGANG